MTARLPNAFRLGPGIYAGGQPLEPCLACIGIVRLHSWGEQLGGRLAWASQQAGKQRVQLTGRAEKIPES